MSKNEIELLLSILVENISIIPHSKIKKLIPRAEKIIGKIDPFDVSFVATILSTDNEGIWTNDKHFLKAKEIKVWTTRDLISYLDKI